MATLGPDSSRLTVRTYREGIAAKAGHDLVIEVTRWEATVEADSIELTADPRSLEIREGLRGAKPLTDRDRREIRKNIDEKVLGGQEIAFRSNDVERPEGAGALRVNGELTMAGATRPLAAELQLDAAGRATGTVTLRQSDWGIRPYRGLMGALKVRDEVEVEIDARLG